MAKPKKRSSKAKVKSLPTSRSRSKGVKAGNMGPGVKASPMDPLINTAGVKALIYFAAQPPGAGQIR